MSGSFLSCDWGTSAFRLHLVDGASAAPAASVGSTDGINAVHGAWKAAGANAAGREEFYLEVIRRQLARLARQTGRTLAELPLVVSGMATATVGLREIAYKEMPFAADGSDLRSEILPATTEFPHPLVLISGARVPDDVMRGEETQLVGAVALRPVREGLFLFPGTHSKHVQVRDGRAVTLRTYMTGEFFELLARHSILANSIEAADDDSAEARAAFGDGVQTGARENLLHAGFGVRVGQISGTRSRRAGYHYLSGLVLGSELREARPDGDAGVTLVGNLALAARYERALRLLGWRGPVEILSAEAAVIAGQRRIAAPSGLLRSAD